MKNISHADDVTDDVTEWRQNRSSIYTFKWNWHIFLDNSYIFRFQCHFRVKSSLWPQNGSHFQNSAVFKTVPIWIHIYKLLDETGNGVLFMKLSQKLTEQRRCEVILICSYIRHTCSKPTFWAVAGQVAISRKRMIQKQPKFVKEWRMTWQIEV